MDHLLVKMAGKTNVSRMREMSYSWIKIRKWSVRIQAINILMLLLSIVLFVKVDNKIFGFAPMFIALLHYQACKEDIKQRYQYFVNQRQFEFLYFFELLVPHLTHASSSKSGLYKVLNTLEKRLKTKEEGSDGILKDGVNRLILEMSNQPGEVEPFKTFGAKCSGTELGEDVSIALFDWQQNSDDIQSIHRLKRKVHIAKEKRIDQITNRKIAKFNWYSQRQVMAVFIFMLGVLGTSVINELLTMFNQLN